MAGVATAHPGQAVRVDSIKFRVEGACGFSG